MINNSLKKMTGVGADVFEPLIFNIKKVGERRAVEKLILSRQAQHIVDDYDEQLRELFGIKNPTMVYTPVFEEKFQAYRSTLIKKAPLTEHGRWIFYPWRSTLVHALE